MKQKLRKIIKDLDRGKKVPLHVKRRNNRCARNEKVSALRTSNLRDSNTNWPQIVPREIKDECLSRFLDATSSNLLRKKVCAICGEDKLSSDLHPTLMELTEKDVEMLSRDESSPIHDRLEFHPVYSGLYLDPLGIVDEENGKSLLRMCRTCLSRLDDEKLPPKSIANGLEIGDVPDCLKDLSVVEESMIARRRARCCVIHLKDDKSRQKQDEGPEDARTPLDQRGFRGHIIVYPQHVENLDSVLPPPLETALTPICVVFVGSTKPTKEWLMKKAKPLIVRRRANPCCFAVVKNSQSFILRHRD